MSGNIRNSNLAIIGAALALVAWAGCRPDDAISHYRVTREPEVAQPVETPAARDGLLGAIVPRADQGWFFKLTGPVEETAPLSDAFREFVASVRFVDDHPEWTLPEGWKQREGSGLRYATIEVPAKEKPLELSVSRLPKPPGDEAAFLLVNINRWRDQLRLPPLPPTELDQNSARVQLADGTATLVSLTGQLKPSNMSRAPFAPGAASGQ